MPQKFRLSAGWEVMTNSAGRRKYILLADNLLVKKIDGRKWHLFHRGVDCGHKFGTAQAAIEYSEDARFGG